MGGRITVESTLHKGSKFTIDLPVKFWDKVKDEASAEKKAAQELAVQDQLSGSRILLCEDNHINAEIVQLLLRNKKINVEWALNGQEGVDKFKASEPGYYDMILMDIRMPVLDGLQATQAIRKLSRAEAETIPIIAMTADVFEETIQEAQQVGLNDYLTKPIVPATLYQMIFKHLQKKQVRT